MNRHESRRKNHSHAIYHGLFAHEGFLLPFLLTHQNQIIVTLSFLLKVSRNSGSAFFVWDVLKVVFLGAEISKLRSLFWVFWVDFATSLGFPVQMCPKNYRDPLPRNALVLLVQRFFLGGEDGFNTKGLSSSNRKPHFEHGG